MAAKNRKTNRVKSESKSSIIKDEIADHASLSAAAPSGHMETDEDVLSIEMAPKFSPSSKLLKEVVIPLKSRSTEVSKRPVCRKPARSLSSLSSLGTTADDQSSEYETPGTSAVATPAEYNFVNGPLFGDPSNTSATARKGPKVTAIARAQQLRDSKFSQATNSTKRKRNWEETTRDEEDTSPDAQFARALQEQEYEDEPSKRSRTGIDGSIHLGEVEDSMDEGSDVSLSSLIDFEEPVSYGRKGKEKASLISRRSVNIRTPAKKSTFTKPSIARAKVTGNMSSLPSRAARDSAKKLIAEKSVPEVQDSEESESEFLSEMDTSDLEDLSDAESNNAEDAPSANPPPTATTTAVRANRARQRHLPRVRGLEGRVSALSYIF